MKPILMSGIDRSGSAHAGDQGTQLFALDRPEMSDVAASASPGSSWLTDGEVHDVPTGDVKKLRQAIPAPLHVLLSGQPDEADRHLVVAERAELWDRR